MTMPDSVSDAAGKPRDVNYDLLRVVAMCLVIGVHVISAVRVVHGLQSAVHYGVGPVQPDIRCRPAGEHPLSGPSAGLWL